MLINMMKYDEIYSFSEQNFRDHSGFLLCRSAQGKKIVLVNRLASVQLEAHPMKMEKGSQSPQVDRALKQLRSFSIGNFLLPPKYHL